MEEKKSVNISYWKEPAHPAVVNLYDSLVSVYTRIREEYQNEIDNAFDRVSRQIGFVVTTTLPVVLELGEGGTVKGITMGAEHLKGTLFDKELSPVLKPLVGKKLYPDPAPWLKAGTYKLILPWFEALNLKLQTDWMEPVHFVRGELATSIQPKSITGFLGRNCPWCEPAQWFDPGIAMAVEDAVLIEAINKVYPELKLVDRVASIREALRKVGPGVKEPVHFRQIESGMQEETAKDVLSELAMVLRKYGY